MKVILSLFGVALLILSLIALKVLILSKNIESDSKVYIGWEGIIKDTNFRDVGESLNECLGKNLFKNDKLYRANQWFSGWSCSAIHNPDVIVSLNYDPLKPETFYCADFQNTRIATHVIQSVELVDLEFLETWKNKAQRDPTCSYLKTIMTSVIDHKRTLVHCDAGRDRTGTVSAILGAMVLEHLKIDQKISDAALECDYRKTKSLKPYKYGRMQNFINEIQKRGGVVQFLKENCEIDPTQSNLFIEQMKN